MCGIVGILGKEAVAPQLVDALKRLEYRGYDSAGVATICNKALDRRRAPGKLRNLEQLLNGNPLAGTIGIGHTRWATHGIPNETNAHPHRAGNVAAVHNGIIENFRELRDELTAKGHVFESETDTETVVHLINDEILAGKKPVEAVSAVLGRLEGAFSLAIIFGDEEDLMIGARRGSPLAVGHGDGEMYLGSDSFALAPFTDEVTYLEEGDWVVLTRTSATYFDENNKQVERCKTTAQAAANIVDKGNFKHFMEKEIHEQPEVIQHTLSHYVDFANGTVRLNEALPFDFATLSRISLSACGTAYYAGVVAKYWFERLARIPVDMDVASEFRYREMPMPENGLALFISQSGETADTLASLRYCKQQGAAYRLHRQRAGKHHRPRERRDLPDPCRCRNRRCLNQGLHLPAVRALGPCHHGGTGAGNHLGRRRESLRQGVERIAEIHPSGPQTQCGLVRSRP